VSENWHEERDRLVALLAGIEMGTVTHVDQGPLRHLVPSNPHNVAKLRGRLAQLNARLGDSKVDSAA
jgi:hypothetical protein